MDHATRSAIPGTKQSKDEEDELEEAEEDENRR